jgi:hypothetical protein
VESKCVFNGFNSTDKWTPDVENVFKQALKDSIPLVNSADDINVTHVGLSSGDSRRHLSTIYLTVSYTLLVS